MNKNEIDEKILNIKKECDDYKHTVWVLIAFANHSCWDFINKKIIPQSKYSFGKRMKTIQNVIVTPDLVVQRSQNYGLICEAQKNFPVEREYWDKTLNQLLNYDDIQEGWFFNLHNKHYDIVFLTDMSRCVIFGDYYENSGKTFKHKFSIVGFEPTTETADTFITLKQERGGLSDIDFNKSLREVVKISFTSIRNIIGEKKFYDSEPHQVYTARIIWENICGEKVSPDTWNKEKKAHIISLSLDEVTEKLQKFYGQVSSGKGEQEIPNKKWVRKVFKFLEQVGYVKVTDNTDTFIVIWKEIKRDILGRFARLWISIKEREKKEKTNKKYQQLDLID